MNRKFKRLANSTTAALNDFDPEEHGCHAIVTAWFQFTVRAFTQCMSSCGRAKRCARTLEAKECAEAIRRSAKRRFLYRFCDLKNQ